ncbi:MAG TPA: FAD-dependent oxidoreductase [Gemmatimonadota bacterium]|nr:FAD-dependent oxidoreductase [Gemmatimonadota bacterium]
MSRRLAILGGGPVGLECLLRAVADGWDARLYERERVGAHVRAWGHVRMFSPWSMNLSSLGRAAVGDALPPGDALPTGEEYAAAYLDRLAALPALAGRIALGTEVLAVARDDLGKDEAIGAPERTRRPFRLLLRDDSGEREVTTDIVVDATGVFGAHNWLGAGGAPAVGETAAGARIEYRLPDLEGRDRARFAGRRVVVVGAGHSAATAVGALADVAAAAPGTRVAWVTRADRERPVVEVSGDPLTERARVTGRANAIAAAAAPWLEQVPGARVRALVPDGAGVRVEVENGGPVALEADIVLALVGYRPDPGLARELQVQICWATEGTYPLAAALLAREGGAADCLAAGGLGPDTLVHPEPGYFAIGAKSYGRNPDFLIRAGIEQVDQLFGILGGEA